MKKEKLQEILRLHGLWLSGNPEGCEANLRGAYLSEANLRGADLDFASWPLWCGSLNTKVDERLARQILYHAFAVASEFCPPTKKQLAFVNQFHRIPEVPALEVKK